MDYTLPGHPDPKSIKGRIVTLEFDTLYVVGTYVVNAGTGLKVSTVKQSRCLAAHLGLDFAGEEGMEHPFHKVHP